LRLSAINPKTADQDVAIGGLLQSYSVVRYKVCSEGMGSSQAVFNWHLSMHEELAEMHAGALVKAEPQLCMQIGWCFYGYLSLQ